MILILGFLAIAAGIAGLIFGAFSERLHRRTKIVTGILAVGTILSGTIALTTDIDNRTNHIEQACKADAGPTARLDGARDCWRLNKNDQWVFVKHYPLITG